MHASILCKNGQIKCISGSTETRGRDRYHERAAKTSSVAEIVLVCPQIRRAPTRNSDGLAARSVGGMKGEKERRQGLLIGVARGETGGH
jgi:NAD(P)H-hydrate repair Nnr-like enzyme with NAD(P)H-hydrate dehydratase domain